MNQIEIKKDLDELAEHLKGIPERPLELILAEAAGAAKMCKWMRGKKKGVKQNDKARPDKGDAASG